jgi:hypothetical protein
LAQLGPFDYGESHLDGVKRVKKGIILQENKAKYEGQWNEATGKKDGMGV